MVNGTKANIGSSTGINMLEMLGEKEMFNVEHLDDCFGEPNSIGKRLFTVGAHSRAKVRAILNTELLEFVASEYNCSVRNALTAIFNGGFVRCAVCARIITKDFKSESCSIKCGRQMSLKHLRDTGKMESVSKKCKAISTKWWAEMDSELKDWIIGRLHAGQRERIDSTTEEERKVAFNYNPNGYYESLREFYSNLSKEDFLKMRQEIGFGMRKDKDYRDAYIDYNLDVWRITANTYAEYVSEINPNSLERGQKAYHLDHKYSICQGFKDGIPPEVIGSKHNLGMMWYIDNIKKSASCSITKEALLELYNGGA